MMDHDLLRTKPHQKLWQNPLKWIVDKCDPIGVGMQNIFERISTGYENFQKRRLQGAAGDDDADGILSWLLTHWFLYFSTLHRSVIA